ncbi:PhoH family protein [Phenylobacterium sp.]|uniref:PhoH family protein n=1 Tax=Phenylobacterium sp. TaxID=1871053 RepID=UPI00271C1B21|nr:PhoH family protein [Phenylobacterium sp.]MDO8799821.1 PhoH family protein [Phenylobacterium sp.]
MELHHDSTRATASKVVSLPPQLVERLLSGQGASIRRIEQALRPYSVRVSPRPDALALAGEEIAVTLAAAILEKIAELLRSEGGHEGLVEEAIAAAIGHALKFDLAYRLKGISQAVRPMSLSQVGFMNTLLHSDRSLIFGVGPTGTGKTHLAIAAGLSLLAEGRIKHLVMTRPRVMLEGEVMTAALRAETAYDEQLIPIEDELRQLIGHDEIQQLTERGMIEVMPLGRMRGRTFNDSMLLVDEAQNMTVSKMRMAATRIGRNGRLVVTGDPAQVDLTGGEEVSGLTHLLKLVTGTDLAAVHRFETYQIIRNPVVARLEALYSQAAAGGAALQAAA